MPVPASRGSATWATASSYRSNERSEGNESRPSELAALSGVAPSQSPGATRSRPPDCCRSVVVLVRAHELLDAAAGDRLGHVHDPARGIDLDRMREGELARVVPGTADAGRHRAEGAVDDPDGVVPQVGVVDPVLVAVRRQRQIARALGSQVSVRHERGGVHRNVALEVAHLVEDPDLAVRAIAGIDEAVLAQHHAVRMAAIVTWSRTRCRRATPDARRPPLAHEGPGGIEDDDAVVAVPVGNVDVATLPGDGIRIRIDTEVRGVVQ